MSFDNVYSTLRQEKEQRAAEAAQRERAITAKAQALSRELVDFIQVRAIDRASVDSPTQSTLLVKKGGQSLKLVVNESDRFSVSLNVGEPFTTLDNVTEDKMKRAIVQWLCPDLR